MCNCYGIAVQYQIFTDHILFNCQLQYSYCLKIFVSVKFPHNHWYGTQLQNPGSEIKVPLKYFYGSPHTVKPSDNELFGNHALWVLVICSWILYNTLFC